MVQRIDSIISGSEPPICEERVLNAMAQSLVGNSDQHPWRDYVLQIVYSHLVLIRAASSDGQR